MLWNLKNWILNYTNLFLQPLSNHILFYPIPVNFSYAYSFGSLVGLFFVISTSVFLVMQAYAVFFRNKKKQLAMQKNFKKKGNFHTKNVFFVFKKPTILTKKSILEEVTKLKKHVISINFFGFKLGIIQYIISTYLVFQKDIIFHATGWFPIPENIHWYNIAIILILLRVLVFLTTDYLTKYIKTLSNWTEKKKKYALLALGGINIITLPLSWPWIGTVYRYLKGNEILVDHGFLGTFRRILTENEKKNYTKKLLKPL